MDRELGAGQSSRFPPFRWRTWRTIALVAAGIVTVGITTQRGLASDHQDTPEVELNPRMDINDVYAFPGASADRIAIELTTSSPIAGQTASFDPDLLYQLKVDNTGDAVEDLVFQVTFDDGTGANQKYTIRGPVAPSMTGTIMSFWLLTVAAGNGLVALITRFAGGARHDASVTPGRFLAYALITFVVSVVFVLVAVRYRYRDAPVDSKVASSA